MPSIVPVSGLAVDHMRTSVPGALQQVDHPMYQLAPGPWDGQEIGTAGIDSLHRATAGRTGASVPA
jgi:hypothetical protein